MPYPCENTVHKRVSILETVSPVEGERDSDNDIGRKYEKGEEGKGEN
jgi:hypothetical protein